MSVLFSHLFIVFFILKKPSPFTFKTHEGKVQKSRSKKYKKTQERQIQNDKVMTLFLMRSTPSWMSPSYQGPGARDRIITRLDQEEFFSC